MTARGEESRDLVAGTLPSSVSVPAAVWAKEGVLQRPRVTKEWTLWHIDIIEGLTD